MVRYHSLTLGVDPYEDVPSAIGWPSGAMLTRAYKETLHKEKGRGVLVKKAV